MKFFKFKIHLGVWFFLAVFIPSLGLSYLALQTLGREEAFLEKKLSDSLQAEINHTSAVIKTELKNIVEELTVTLAQLPVNIDYAQKASRWRAQSLLVQTPFFVSNNEKILWPTPETQLSAQEKFFFKWSADFLGGRETTPVYENIAQVYKDDILKDSQQGGYQASSSPYQNKGQGSQQVASSSSSVWDQSPTRGEQQLQENIGEQYSPYYFEKNQPVREQIYSKAQASGQKVLKRQVTLPQEKTKGSVQPVAKEESMFISDDLKFSEITSRGQRGIIPYIIKEKLHLIFWQRQKDNTIAGCLLDTASVTARIVRLLPPIYSSVRILTALNENGWPIIKPDENFKRDWSRPFAAAEISEILPRWEVVAYLTQPQAIANKAHVTEVFGWILISILLVSIVFGGTLVLRSLNSEIRLAQQKTTFAANVSHELKTPLTSLRMFTEMLKENRQPDETKRRQYFEIMLSETERLTRLINNILDFSRIGKTKKKYHFQKLDLVPLCQTLLENQRVRLEYSGFEVKFSASDKNLFVNADEEAVKQILINLISNAEKYSDTTKAITLILQQKDPWAVVNILDRGIGIAPRHTQKIFEEFFRVDDSLTAKTQGTGLGLTIARRIARDMGGDIVYYPREGGGSIFQIQLPLLKDTL